MSFKVEIEIKKYQGRYCGYCKSMEIDIPNGSVLYCNVFDERLYLDNEYRVKRCPQCLEAEKKYKEKENA